jgi:hypothetical protein
VQSTLRAPLRSLALRADNYGKAASAAACDASSRRAARVASGAPSPS